jgi:NADH dehydrogenase FAD-containing subunit
MQLLGLVAVVAVLSISDSFRLVHQRVPAINGRQRLSEREGRSEDEVRRELSDRRETYGGVYGDGAAPDVQFVDSLKSKRSYASIVVERLMQSWDDSEIAGRMKNHRTRSSRNSGISASVSKREKIVVLGSGWGAHSFLKTVDAEKYEVVVVSPRNYFLFTPMLAASAVGTVEFRSICEPIRNANARADYLEATAVSVNSTAKTVSCLSVKCSGTSCSTADFDIPYDHLVVAVGATSNTFGIKGVRENCLFLKQIEDASSLRTAILSCFERANVPSMSEQERISALSFVVVGAGPTGVEFTSELRDFVECEGKKYYSQLLKYVRIRLVEAGDAVLPVFDKALQAEALRQLLNRKTSLISEGLIEKELTEVILKAGVREITGTSVLLSSGEEVEEIPYGFCVWAAGNGPVPVVLDMIQTVDAQKTQQQKARGRLCVDSWQRVLGAEGVLSIGDCAFNPEAPLPATAQVASQQGAYLGRLFSKGYNLRAAQIPFKVNGVTDVNVSPSERLNLGELGIRRSDTETVYAKPFQFLNLGILAYIGASEALAQVTVDDKNILGSGPVGYLLWRGIYWSKQVSWRNRVLVGVDWFKARVFGRDIGSI